MLGLFDCFFNAPDVSRHQGRLFFQCQPGRNRRGGLYRPLHTSQPVAAVFSVAFGVALIGVENKRSLREILTAISKTLTRIAMMVVKITPIGVFAIAPMLRAP